MVFSTFAFFHVLIFHLCIFYGILSKSFVHFLKNGLLISLWLGFESSFYIPGINSLSDTSVNTFSLSAA